MFNFNSIKKLIEALYQGQDLLHFLFFKREGAINFLDFDLSDLTIYISEFRTKIGAERCRYVIPDNINQLIAHSKNRHLYLKQLDDPKVKSINFEEYAEIAGLAKLIMKHKTTIKQEALMESSNDMIVSNSKRRT